MSTLSDAKIREHLDNVAKAINDAERDAAQRVPPAKAAEVAEKFGTIRDRLAECGQRLSGLLASIESGRPANVDPALHAALDAAHAEAAKAKQNALARLAAMPVDPPDNLPELLNGHALGKLLLTELGIVADRSPHHHGPIVIKDGFRWESTGEWDALGL